MKQIGILIFPNVEELDFVGPFETIAYLNKLKPSSTQVSIISKTKEIVTAFNGLRVVPDLSLDECPQFHTLIIPGGQGRHQAMFDKDILNFVRKQAQEARYICSVCTGAFVLGEAGLLDGLSATTHHTALEEMRERYPNTNVIAKKVVDNGKIMTAAGISSGIDLALDITAKLYDEQTAQEIAKRLEYSRTQN